LLGFEVTPDGAVLIEAVAGMDAPIAVPEALATPEERAMDRWLGKAPAGLAEVMGGEALEIARTVVGGVARRAAGAGGHVGTIEMTGLARVTREDDPMPDGFVARPGARVPIGWIDAGIGPTGEAWIGGDVLVPAYVRAQVAGGAASSGVPVEGASLADLVEAV